MQLYFIRHAQSNNNVLLDQTGTDASRSEDPELSELGYKQTQVLAKYLGKSALPTNQAGELPDIQTIHLTHLYSSLMVRALATGAAISGATGLSLTGWPCLHEVGGIYQKDPLTGTKQGLPGHTKSYLEQRFPGLVLPGLSAGQGWWNRQPEDDHQGLDRARCVYQNLLERHGRSADRVGLISHGDFYQLLLSVVLDLKPENMPFFKLNNAAVTRIDFEGNQIRVMYLNRIDYMPPQCIT
ncbi:MAG: histidine phosphatase family protein [Anaerolineaceae bacterium]|nr:histidine phosphatase family protein [Anaerolineaceae bacterium]